MRRRHRKVSKAFLLVAGALLTFIPPVPATSAANSNRATQYAAFERPLSKPERFQHALERLTFGPRPGELDNLQHLGLKKWLDLQLHPARVPENPILLQRLAPLETLRLSIRDTYLKYPTPREAESAVASDLTEGKLLRAIYSNRQLEELLVDFWFNHFNVDLNKGADRFDVPSYERESIRPYVFGRFYDMLLATAESPAMLFYLDNWQSAGPQQSGRPAGKHSRGLNENYGRELLELHTLGVDGGYTQKDVTEVARCFTGWTIANPHKGGEFKYEDSMHDQGEKVVLRHRIAAGGGVKDGFEVLDIVAHHPATAHHIAFELAQRFLADDPPPSLVDTMTQTYLKTDGDLRRVLKTLLDSKEFWSEGAYHAKIKTPLEVVASAVRAGDADATSTFVLGGELQKMGEPLYRKLEPTGYSFLNSEWINSAGLLARMNFSAALASNRIPGIHFDPAKLPQFSNRDPALTFGGPEFQHH